ncbi:MAG: ATP-binding cassette domain-containing protein [Verrucomicrobiales bacterium]|nr:ATP-binding cassette domain-containing protein [Verrucomicrobiales bacterium]
MLELIQLSRQSNSASEEPGMLQRVSLFFPGGQVTALAGAAGSGKSLLLKLLAGDVAADHGTLTLDGQDVGRCLKPHQFAWVESQRGALYAELTVEETLASSLQLHRADLSGTDLPTHIESLIETIGLTTAAKKSVKELTLAQARRLLLGTALVCDPSVLLLDEWLQGLDAKSERELLATLKAVARARRDRVVLLASRSLAHTTACDSVALLQEGGVIFHGPARALPHYFSIQSLEETYARLAMRPASRWIGSWSRHRDAYYEAFQLRNPAAEANRDTDSRVRLPRPEEDETSEAPEDTPAEETSPEDVPSVTLPMKKSHPAPAEAALSAPASSKETSSRPAAPSIWQQTLHLTRRRWTLLRRRRKEWLPTLATLLGLPLIAQLLLRSNLPVLRASEGSADPAHIWPAAFTVLAITFIQVLMVIFASGRLAAPEIAQDRPVFERERHTGLRPLAWLLAKLFFIFPLALAQALWLGLFLQIFSGGLPGALGWRLLLLAATALGFSSLCLGISAHCPRPGRARGIGFALAFAQVLLAGALLGLPPFMARLINPLITAHYGWSGIMDSLSGHPLFEPMTQLTPTWFATPRWALMMLMLHTLVGLVFALRGLRRRSL